VAAAAGRAVVDFGLRRTQGIDAGMKGARAFYIAGVSATSNVAAGQVYGLPIAGTMAHSYIQAHDDEGEAFRRFASLYPDSTILVDTYDTRRGVERVIGLARELGPRFRVRALRLDSGNLAALSVEARHLLDEAGLTSIQIFASGGLDEDTIAALVERGAPIDGFGVGTEMAVSADAPRLDIVYKLVSYAGADRIKLSPGKPIYPGRKQVFRQERDGVAVRDVIARSDERGEGRPLLIDVMKGGRRLPAAVETLEAIRARAAAETARLPEPIRALPRAEPPYPVDISPGLRERYDRAERSHHAAD
jgi:nicotinate phosphoribosyltransferase